MTDLKIEELADLCMIDITLTSSFNQKCVLIATILAAVKETQKLTQKNQDGKFQVSKSSNKWQTKTFGLYSIYIDIKVYFSYILEAAKTKKRQVYIGP